MSDFFIVVLPQGNAPQVDIDALYDRLKSSWNILHLQRREDNEPDILSRDVDIDGSVVTGYVGNDRTSLTVDGNIDAVAKFVVWFREFISHEYLLFLFEQSYIHGTMEINSNTTEKHIIEVFWP